MPRDTGSDGWVGSQSSISVSFTESDLLRLTSLSNCVFIAFNAAAEKISGL